MKSFKELLDLFKPQQRNIEVPKITPITPISRWEYIPTYKDYIDIDSVIDKQSECIKDASILLNNINNIMSQCKVYYTDLDGKQYPLDSKAIDEFFEKHKDII